MAEFMMTEVEALEQRGLEWHDTYGKVEAADAAVAQEMQAVREQHTRNGLLMTSEAALAKYEADWRVQRDREAFGKGGELELELMRASARCEEAIASCEALKSSAELHGASTSNYLMASLLDEQRHVRARGEIAGLTRLQLAELYATLRDADEASNAAIRMIEQAVVMKTLDRLGLQDDPASDAVAIPKLTAAVQERRRARVPSWLFEARARLAQVRSTSFMFALTHLKSGRGIASRPHPPKVA
jgi:hypothetical protein